MSETYERLRQIIAEANMRVLDRPTSEPAYPGTAMYTRAIIHALETGPKGCAVHVTITPTEAENTTKRALIIFRDGRRLSMRRIGPKDNTCTYEFTIAQRGTR